MINKIKDNIDWVINQPLDLPFKIVLFTDAALGNLSYGGSQGGHAIFLVDKHNKSNLISWQSKCIKRTVRSTLTAEIIAMMDGVESAIYISVLLKGLHPHLNTILIEIYTDNKFFMMYYNPKNTFLINALELTLVSWEKYCIRKLILIGLYWYSLADIHLYSLT